jgi:hypothetical protein
MVVFMDSTPDLLKQGPAGHLTRNGGAILILWMVSGLAVAFLLYLVIYPLLAKYRMRRAASRASEANVLEKPDFPGTSAPVWDDYLETACNHCQRPLFVVKVRQFKPFFCPHCSQMNPPLKKKTLAWASKFLRWLLYPSFQDFF